MIIQFEGFGSGILEMFTLAAKPMWQAGKEPSLLFYIPSALKLIDV